MSQACLCKLQPVLPSFNIIYANREAGALDIRLELWLQSERGASAGPRCGCRAPASGTSTGASVRWWHTTPQAAATSIRVT